MSKFFGVNNHTWERSLMDNRASSEKNFEHIQEASKNPEKYTTSQPNGSVKPAFFTTSTKGAGKDGLKAGPKTYYYEVPETKDDSSSSSEPTAVSAPAVEAPPEEDSPVYASAQASKAQNLVNAYKSNIMNDSPYKTKVESNTPNLNTQGTNVLGAYESNTFGAPEAIEPAESKAADSFLQSKKLELGSGLNLQ